MGSQASATRPRFVFAIILFACLFAAAAGKLLLRYGIKLTPDSWAYWTSSVSLLHGNGYYHFDGRPIPAWPPGYAFFLAGWEYFAGVSGKSLAMANLLLIVLATCTWTIAFLVPFKPELEQAASARKRSLILPFLASLFISATIVSYLRLALAHNLVYVFYPLVMYTTHRTLAEQSKGGAGIRPVLVNVLLLSIVLVSHNSFFPLPVLVGAVLAFYPGLKAKIKVRWPVAGCITVIPIAAWFVTRWYLHQLRSHTTHDTPKYTWGPYAHQAFAGIAKLFGPERLHFGTLLLLVTCLILLLSALRLYKSKYSATHGVICYALLAMGTIAAEYVEFNKTFVDDEMYFPRFILFVPLTLLPAMAMLCWHRQYARLGASATQSPGASPSSKAGGCAFCVVGVGIVCAICISNLVVMINFIYQSRANAGPVDTARAVNDTMFAYNRMTVDYHYAKGPPKEENGLVVVSPEDREWHAPPKKPISK